MVRKGTPLASKQDASTVGFVEALNAFKGAICCPKRASCKSQEEFKTHVSGSCPEFNHRYAHPIELTWTNRKMRRWFAKYAS
jgi:hypothetical protein